MTCPHSRVTSRILWKNNPAINHPLHILQESQWAPAWDALWKAELLSDKGLWAYLHSHRQPGPSQLPDSQPKQITALWIQRVLLEYTQSCFFVCFWKARKTLNILCLSSDLEGSLFSVLDVDSVMHQKILYLINSNFHLLARRKG